MKISAGEFKTNCLKLMDEVARTHEPLIITKHGKPIARIIPAEDEEKTVLFGYMAGTAKIRDNIISPIEVDWEAMDKSEK